MNIFRASKNALQRTARTVRRVAQQPLTTIPIVPAASLPGLGLRIGKAGSAIAKGATGNVTIWAYNSSGTWAATSEVVSCRNEGDDVEANKLLVIGPYAGKAFIFGVLEC